MAKQTSGRRVSCMESDDFRHVMVITSRVKAGMEAFPVSTYYGPKSGVPRMASRRTHYLRQIKGIRSWLLMALVCLPWAIHATDGHANREQPVSTQRPRLDVDISLVEGKDGTASAVGVAYVYRPISERATSLDFDTLEPMLLRVTDQVTKLQVSDDRGTVAVSGPVKKVMNGENFQSWTFTRPIQGMLRVNYVIPVAKPLTPKRGPHLDLQAAGGGLSGAFVGFMLWPHTDAHDYQVTVRWHLPSGQRAVSSQGEGDFAGNFSYQVLMDTLFLAGPVQVAAGDAAGHFKAYVLGMDARQLASLSAWAAKAYDVESTAFRVAQGQPYRFMVRSYAGGPIDSGRSSDHAFMLYLPAGFDPDNQELHSLVAHEMVHSLVKDLDDAPGDEGDWYTEGTADYFSQTLPFRAGLYTRDEYRELVNSESAEYYTNALRDVDNKQLSRVMWSGRNAWTLPYARGALYFADLNAQLRKHGSHLTVLDLVNETSARIAAGATADASTWKNVLSNKVGDWAVEHWRNMMAGRLLMLAPDAFGRCLVGKAAKVGAFDLGFAKPVRVTAGQAIEGVKSGSNAAKAGLQDGDIISQDIDINPLASSFNAPMRLAVHREGKEKLVVYDPHSGSLDGMVWELGEQYCNTEDR